MGDDKQLCNREFKVFRHVLISNKTMDKLCCSIGSNILFHTIYEMLWHYKIV